MKALKKSAVFVGLMAVAGLAAAQTVEPALDTTAVVTGINDAKQAILNVISALTALSVAIFGVAKVYAFIKRKAGA